jgi:undecaprenyl diphosphate synthase
VIFRAAKAAPRTVEAGVGADESGGSAAGAVPRHVAIIMDGNGRWAKAKGLPRAAGHKQGAEAARKVLRAAGEAGVECLTLYAFSSENWRRSAEEVGDLMGLLRFYLRSEIESLHKEGVRLRIIGDYKAFSPDIVALIEQGVARTAGNARMTLAIALNYGGRAELVGAVQRLAARAAAGELAPEAIDEAAVEAELDTADLPPLDLLIRTSGEYRLSNFLLWQAAYAELLFVDTLWPDFGAEALSGALAAYGGRERRFGGR